MCVTCNRLLPINANLDTNATATIVVANTALLNQDACGLCYMIGWTGAIGSERLQIQVGATGSTPTPLTYPVLDRQGNPVLIGRLRQEQTLCLKFVSPVSSPAVIPAHFVLYNPLCPQILVTPVSVMTVTQQGGASGPSSGATGMTGATGATGATGR